MATALCGIVIIPGCSDTPAEQAQQTSETLSNIADNAAKEEVHTNLQWEKERSAILTDLRDLRASIDKDLDATNVTLAKKDLRSIERSRQENMKVELEREKVLLDGAIASVEGIGTEAPADERSNTRVAAEKVRDDVKSWWAARKEEQDRHTSADFDKDGH